MSDLPRPEATIPAPPVARRFAWVLSVLLLGGVAAVAGAVLYRGNTQPEAKANAQPEAKDKEKKTYTASTRMPISGKLISADANQIVVQIAGTLASSAGVKKDGNKATLSEATPASCFPRAAFACYWWQERRRLPTRPTSAAGR